MSSQFVRVVETESQYQAWRRELFKTLYYRPQYIRDLLEARTALQRLPSLPPNYSSKMFKDLTIAYRYHTKWVWDRLGESDVTDLWKILSQCEPEELP